VCFHGTDAAWPTTWGYPPGSPGGTPDRAAWDSPGRIRSQGFGPATALIIGIADFTFSFGEVSFNGIALGTIAAIVISHLMRGIARVRGTDAAPVAPADQPPSSVSIGPRTK
jgi:hypothetical protein